MDCIFCKIIRGDIPSNKVFEDDQILAFLDIQPISRGHTLVIPKKHSDNILQTDEETLATTVKSAQKIAAAVMKATGADGFNLTVSSGAIAGQTVFHLHFHIIPRFSNDGLKSWPRSESEMESLEEAAEAIKIALAS